HLVAREVDLAPAPRALRRRPHGRDARQGRAVAGPSRVVAVVDRVLIRRARIRRAPGERALHVAARRRVLPLRLAGAAAAVPDADGVGPGPRLAVDGTILVVPGGGGPRARRPARREVRVGGRDVGVVGHGPALLVPGARVAADVREAEPPREVPMLAGARFGP